MSKNMAHIRKVFNLLDLDKNGKISLDELKNVLLDEDGIF